MLAFFHPVVSPVLSCLWSYQIQNTREPFHRIVLAGFCRVGCQVSLQPSPFIRAGDRHTAAGDRMRGLDIYNHAQKVYRSGIQFEANQWSSCQELQPGVQGDREGGLPCVGQFRTAT